MTFEDWAKYRGLPKRARPYAEEAWKLGVEEGSHHTLVNIWDEQARARDGKAMATTIDQQAIERLLGE